MGHISANFHYFTFRFPFDRGHPDDLGGKGFGQFFIMGDHDGGAMMIGLGLQQPELFQRPPGKFPVQRGSRFIHKNQRGFMGYGPGQGHPLVLAPGKFVYPGPRLATGLTFTILGQTKGLKQFIDPVPTGLSVLAIEP